MANGAPSNSFGFVDKRRVRGDSGVVDPNTYKNDIMKGIGPMRTQLVTIDSVYYTNSRLDSMTENDMIYALRDSASI